MAAARKERGLTQEDLAARLGVHQSFISRIESGEASPSLPLARKIIAELGITLDDFGPPPEPSPEDQGPNHTASDFHGGA